MNLFDVWDFGYLPAQTLSEKMLEHINNDKAQPALWLGEHSTVVTLGASAQEQDFQHHSTFSHLKVPRGGRATLHMPGQLMVYPIVPLKKYSCSLRNWVRLLESLLSTIFPTEPFLRCQGEPGVYLPQGKVASLGVKISKGWSYYGLCINVSCPLTPYEKIIPCGLKNRPMTSLHHSKVDFKSMREFKKTIVHTLNLLLKQQLSKSEF